MSEKIMQDYMGQKGEEMFLKVDEAGGWPKDKPFLAFYHAGEMPRECTFFDHEISTGWYTAFLTRDEYLFWQISDKFKERLRVKAVQDFKFRVSILKE